MTIYLEAGFWIGSVHLPNLVKLNYYKLYLTPNEMKNKIVDIYKFHSWDM